MNLQFNSNNNKKGMSEQNHLTSPSEWINNNSIITSNNDVVDPFLWPLETSSVSSGVGGGGSLHSPVSSTTGSMFDDKSSKVSLHFSSASSSPSAAMLQSPLLSYPLSEFSASVSGTTLMGNSQQYGNGYPQHQRALSSASTLMSAHEYPFSPPGYYQNQIQENNYFLHPQQFQYNQFRPQQFQYMPAFNPHYPMMMPAPMPILIPVNATGSTDPVAAPLSPASTAVVTSPPGAVSPFRNSYSPIFSSASSESTLSPPLQSHSAEVLSSGLASPTKVAEVSFPSASPTSDHSMQAASPSVPVLATSPSPTLSVSAPETPLKDEVIESPTPKVSDKIVKLPVSKKVKASRLSHASTEPDSSRKPSASEKKKLREYARNLTCFNCQTNKTPLWRRTVDRQHSLCNACGLFYKQYGCHRPVAYKERNPRSLQKEEALSLEKVFASVAAAASSANSSLENNEMEVKTESTSDVPAPHNEANGLITLHWKTLESLIAAAKAGALAK